MRSNFRVALNVFLVVAGSANYRRLEWSYLVRLLKCPVQKKITIEQEENKKLKMSTRFLDIKIAKDSIQILT